MPDPPPTPQPPLLSIDDALRTVLAHTVPLAATETVTPDRALARVLAEPVHAAHDMPPFASSAMDGYALAEPDHERASTLTLAGEARAGAPYPARLEAGQAIRISTGAQVPEGAVAVIRQEDVTARDDVIDTHVPVSPGANIRRAGEDLRNGTLILERGSRLGPAQIGAAIAAGAGTLVVARRPRVIIVCTGDELRPPGAELEPGQIHNSNGPMLAALASTAGADAQAAPPLPDEPHRTQQELGGALDRADVLIVSGGVSVGPHDHVKPALDRLNVTQHFWGVALQPGKPTWFGTRDEKLVFALPGNPVSTAVTFALFVRPALHALQHATPPRPPASEAELTSEVRRTPQREQAVRVRLHTEQGHVKATPTGAQDSHLFTSLIQADALAMIPTGTEPLPAGTRVRLLAPPA